MAEQHERRQRALTEADVLAISEAVAERLPVCSLGLNAADAAMIKNHLGLYKKARNIIGSVIITAITVIIVGIFTKGFWASLIEGVRK